MLFRWSNLPCHKEETLTRTKSCLSIWVLGMALLCSGVLHAQDGFASYPGSIGFVNPCDAVLVVVNGINHVRIDDDTQEKAHGHEHDRDARGQVNVELRFVGNGKDDKGNPYHAKFIAKGQFGTATTMYDLPFQSIWYGSKDGPSFSVDGTVRVFAQDGKGTGSEITHFETSCRAGEHNDGDHDDSH